MKGNTVLICVFVSGLLCVSCAESMYELKSEIVNQYDSDESEVQFFSGNKRQMPSTVYQTVNKYYCSLHPMIEGSHLIVYGTRLWTFPVQDVNLTLSYPTVDKEDLIEVLHNNGDYVITGFKVILYIDGQESKGYIVNGGVLQEQITLSFVSSQISELRYEFWLYGARKDASPNFVEMNSHYRLC